MGSTAELQNAAAKADDVFEKLQQSMNQPSGEGDAGAGTLTQDATPHQQNEPGVADDGADATNKDGVTPSANVSQDDNAVVDQTTKGDATGERNELEVKLEQLEKELEAKEHKSKSNEGRLKKRIEELEKQIGALSDTITSLRQQPVAPQQPAQEAEDVKGDNMSVSTDDVKGLFSEDEIDLVGEDTIEVAKKISEALIEKALAKQRAEFEPIVNQLKELKEQQSQQSGELFKSELLKDLGLNESSFIRIDTSSAFNHFLEQQDGLSGRTLQDSLMSAIEAGDVKRTSAIYKAFIEKLDAKPSTVSDPLPPRATQPVLAAAEGGEVKTGAPSYSSYKEVAEAFAKGRISQAEKDALMAKLDQEYSQNYGR